MNAKRSIEIEINVWIQGDVEQSPAVPGVILARWPEQPAI
jgi:hypothetical protein